MDNKIKRNFVWFWNLLHYVIYIWQKKAHRIMDSINPFTWIGKLTIIQDFYKKRGIKDINKFTNELIQGDEKGGIGIGLAGGALTVSIMLIEISILHLTIGLTGYLINPYTWENEFYPLFFVASLILPAALINHYLVFRKDRYLIYFKEFKKISKAKIRIYSLFCFLFLLIVLVTLMLSYKMLAFLAQV